ncbi:hypothetical protein DK842_17785 [Chromobacterium phragmitis]|uniref:hypothetical protein n=1 Tax=Chromobacterium phragmitis TaxID=2202141 RepID=UPI000DEC1F71|nr:hypothetical protein [Chromobacterium phragmitis]AXE31587.1 hypothetical protein DK842_17785 [Chromobacterium phragmitis]
MRKQCKRKHRPASFTRMKLVLGKCINTPSNDTDILDEPTRDLEALMRGELSTDGFLRLNEMNVTLCMAGELLRTRGVELTPLVGWQYKQESEIAAAAYAKLAERYSKRGRFVATADELEAFRASLNSLRQIIPALTRGELLTVLTAAADLIESTNGKAA